jgi:hypothetical protein
MSSAHDGGHRGGLVACETGRSVSSGRRLGSAIGLVTITLLDLLALDDITTAGAWMPEIGFVIASVPALITLAYFTFRRPPSSRQLESGPSRERLGP